MKELSQVELSVVSGAGAAELCGCQFCDPDGEAASKKLLKDMATGAAAGAAAGSLRGGVAGAGWGALGGATKPVIETAIKNLPNTSFPSLPMGPNWMGKPLPTPPASPKK
ncbi:E492 group microcin [Xenorhabdus sp. KK7.4]|uniref:E492 group microcin n=1 Tax=Xenorhabdus sp. KK7.4 TaxID=1851572 RepID=UPI000C062862|nr:hypothetical protein [Xenorhabdus sp. KK7.4]PHM56849.1 hypothetical protein Xekk_01760 [Xenorhabdus sp. KK7.4]